MKGNSPKPQTMVNGVKDESIEIKICIKDSSNAITLSTHGIVLLCRSWMWLTLCTAFLLVGLKIWDRYLGGPNTYPYWWEFVLSGAYGKLDDISFWTALVGLFSGILITSSALELVSRRPKMELIFSRGECVLWVIFTFFGFALYFFAIGFPDEKGTFLSVLPPVQRWAQVFEGLINLLLIGAVYILAVFGWKVSATVTKAIHVYADRTPPEAEKPAANSLLRVSSQFANLPFLFIPVLGMVVVTLILSRKLGQTLFAETKWPIFDFTKYQFDPLAGLRKEWPAALLTFVLLSLPLWVSRLRVRRPVWAVTSFNWKKIYLGWIELRKVCVTSDNSDRRFWIVNLLLFKWHI